MHKWYLWVAIMLGLVAVPCQAEQVGILTLPKEDYQTIFQPKDENVYVLTFTAKQWCPPCKNFEENILYPLSTKYAAQEKFHFYLVDMTDPKSEDLQFANQLNVDRYPTTIILHNGISEPGQIGYDEKKGSSEIEKKLAPYK